MTDVMTLKSYAKKMEDEFRAGQRKTHRRIIATQILAGREALPSGRLQSELVNIAVSTADELLARLDKD